MEDPEERLGVQDINDLKEHKFFKSINWSEYQKKTLKSPLKPIIAKHPIRKLEEEIATGNVKIFRQSLLED